MGSLEKQMLTENQHAVVIGTLLGDGHLERNGNHTRLKIDHSHKQREYVFWKHQALKSVAANTPTLVEYYDQRTCKTYKNVRFATRSIAVMDPYWDLFYAPETSVSPVTTDSERMR